MLNFTVVSDGTILSIGPFQKVSALAVRERRQGHEVSVRRATPAELTRLSSRPLSPPRGVGWAVKVKMAGRSDLLHCLDAEDAQQALREVRANGVRAEIVRV